MRSDSCMYRVVSKSDVYLHVYLFGIEKGFCILGENCRYDHGTDPLVIGGDLNPYNPPVPRPLGMPPAGMPIPPMSKTCESMSQSVCL